MKRPNGTTSESVSYSYDYDDLLTSKTTFGTTGAGLNNYVYDGLGRVTSWTARAVPRQRTATTPRPTARP
jgi:YD repeat-containing protein